MVIHDELKYYKLLAESFPTIKDVKSEIINLRAIVNLPKATEHFVSDIHGEYEHFSHVMTTASGAIKEKVVAAYGSSLSETEQTKLANLIYYPERILKEADRDKEWYKETLLRLIKVCNLACAKYTRSKVRKALPEKYAYIIDELLNCDTKSINKNKYYNEIIGGIIELESADDFIIEISALIRKLIIDHLHIVGDIFDRGPRPDLVMDIIMNCRSVDIQWGNHDIVWMGAMLGSEVCIAVVLANSMKYGNTIFLEEGYGISLRKLEHFANRYYSGKNSAEKMYKAISVIRFKLEDMTIRNNPQFSMDAQTKLDKVDVANSKWCGYDINLKELLASGNPELSELTDKEKEIMANFRHSFINSEKMQKHLRYLFDKGSIYKCYNDNLLYHGCIPMDENGKFLVVDIGGTKLSGKKHLDYCERELRKIYATRENPDFFWYMWCSPQSPLFGKKNMTTFERMYIKDKKAHIEEKQPYFNFQDDVDVCNRILKEFDMEIRKGHIINGHIPVKLKEGESPIKANGKLILIDGGMSKTYRKETGIAGYTLTFDSHGLMLTAHEEFENIDELIRSNEEMMSQRDIVQKDKKRLMVKDTDIGKRLSEKINELKNLLFLYDNGILPEKTKKN